MTGAIFIASGRVPKTDMIFVAIVDIPRSVYCFMWRAIFSRKAQDDASNTIRNRDGGEFSENLRTGLQTIVKTIAKQTLRRLGEFRANDFARLFSL
ncbi:hypothetical protein [Trinickia soli]|uniref:hypothetical protein n=1 Tax=Trinickia soli TaxID=380675 RepID=UPI001583BEFD|nr:hypothetical protein [Trinickia soli]